MSLASRGTRITSRTLVNARVRQCTRRNASSGHDHGHGHEHGESALHLPDANPSGNESFGRGMWFTLAVVPIFYVSYTMASGQPGPFDGLYQRYKEGKEDNARRELLHTAGQAQAIADRAKLKSAPRNTNGPELRYPEMFNHGSPHNIVAGHGTANMKELEEFLNNQNAQLEQDRKAKIQNGMVQSVYDTKPHKTS